MWWEPNPASPTAIMLPSIGDMGTLPYGTDQLIDAAMARSLHADACRKHTQVNGYLGVGMVSIMPPPWITVLVPLPLGTMIDCPPPGLVLV
jgi:hypothetical protein